MKISSRNVLPRLPKTKFSNRKKNITTARGMIFKIPARSPDLNSVENFLNIVAKELKKQVVDNNMRKDTFEQFSETMLAYLVEKINIVIETMDKRVTMVLSIKGMSVKY